MLNQLLATRLTPTSTTTDPSADTRYSMGTLTNDSPIVHDRSKLLPTTDRSSGYQQDAGYMNRDFAHDHSSENSGPVALATPVDLHRLAGHISEDDVRR